MYPVIWTFVYMEFNPNNTHTEKLRRARVGWQIQLLSEKHRRATNPRLHRVGWRQATLESRRTSVCFSPFPPLLLFGLLAAGFPQFAPAQVSG